MSPPPLEQLSFFGPAVTIPAIAAVAPPPPPPPPLPSAPADPRQCGLFEGPLADIRALETACERLDVAAARAVWTRASARFPDWAGAQRWPAWLADLAWLVGSPRRPDPVARLARAERAGPPPPDGERFAGMPAGVRARILSATLAGVAAQLVAAQGPAARLPDGRPAGALLLDARPAEAATLLAAAAAAMPQDGLVHLWLGEAHWRCGRAAAALAAYLDAFLAAPAALDAEAIACPLIHDLIDRAADLELPGAASAWVPVLADLDGMASLLGTTVEPAAGGPAATAVAHLLLGYRRRRRAGGLSEPDRLALKRAMLRRAPQLKELVRRL